MKRTTRVKRALLRNKWMRIQAYASIVNNNEFKLQRSSYDYDDDESNDHSNPYSAKGARFGKPSGFGGGGGFGRPSSGGFGGGGFGGGGGSRFGGTTQRFGGGSQSQFGQVQGLSPSQKVTISKIDYQPHPDVASLTHDQIKTMRTTHNPPISILRPPDTTVPAPITKFNYLSTVLSSSALSRLTSSPFNLTNPSPIQTFCMPIALSNYDVVGIAETGSGKTLSFLIPAAAYISSQKAKDIANNPDSPLVLIIAPTRELCSQIAEEARKLFKQDAHVTAMYGQVSKGSQSQSLQENMRAKGRVSEILCATPGRLIDFISSGEINLGAVGMLVLDEADRMMDMGFEPQLRQVLNYLQTSEDGRLTMLYSATWPREVVQIAKQFTNPKKQMHVAIGEKGADVRANKNIEQIVHYTPHTSEKQRLLIEVLEEARTAAEENNANGSSEKPVMMEKVLIFTNTKHEADRVEQGLNGAGWPAVAIHGDKSQGVRERVIAEFKNGRSPVLVATDVASRGIDVKDVRAVVNWNMPKDISSYVHRIGRTGRAGKKGKSVAFYENGDFKVKNDLINVLQEAGQRVPDFLRQSGGMGGGEGGGALSFGRNTSSGGSGTRGFTGKRDFF